MSWDTNILQSYLNELPVLKLFAKQLRKKDSTLFNDVKENCVDISSEIPSFYKPYAVEFTLSSNRSLLLQRGIPLLRLLFSWSFLREL